MNNTGYHFSQENKVIIPFIISGFPSLGRTEELVYEMERAGADIILLGIPFSDPVVEVDAVIKANCSAIEQGVNIEKIFTLVEKIRRKTDIPLIFRSYANTVFSYGIENFVSKASALSVAGLMLPDVPFAEKEEFSSVCERYGMDLISIITPTANSRMEEITEKAGGFLYYIDSALHSQSEVHLYTELEKSKGIIRKHSEIPIVSYLADANNPGRLLNLVNGVVIDGDIIDICQKHPDTCIERVGEYIRKLKLRIGAYEKR